MTEGEDRALGDAALELAAFLEGEGLTSRVLLPRVGWIDTRTFTTFPDGARKRRPFFEVHPDLAREIEGLPIDGGSPDAAPLGDDERPIRRYAWADAIAARVRAAILEGRDAVVPGVGTLRLRDKPAREATNPQTGERVAISARRVLTFVVAPALLERLARGA